MGIGYGLYRQENCCPQSLLEQTLIGFHPILSEEVEEYPMSNLCVGGMAIHAGYGMDFEESHEIINWWVIRVGRGERILQWLKIIQVKHKKSTTDAPEIQQLSRVNLINANNILVATGRFTPAAGSITKHGGVKSVDLSELVDLIVKGLSSIRQYALFLTLLRDSYLDVLNTVFIESARLA